MSNPILPYKGVLMIKDVVTWRFGWGESLWINKPTFQESLAALEELMELRLALLPPMYQIEGIRVTHPHLWRASQARRPYRKGTYESDQPAHSQRDTLLLRFENGAHHANYHLGGLPGDVPNRHPVQPPKAWQAALDRYVVGIKQHCAIVNVKQIPKDAEKEGAASRESAVNPVASVVVMRLSAKKRGGGHFQPRGRRRSSKAFLAASPIETPQPIPLPRPTNRLITLTIELSNLKTDQGNRLRNRTETYTLGVLPGTDAKCVTPPCDVFTFCCYRALLLGDPAVVIRATLQPGGKKILTDPLSPQPLRGEDAVEAREWSNRHALLFRLQRRGGFTNRQFFGYRQSDGQGSPRWLCYQPGEVIRDQATRMPPAFADAEDFQRKIRVLVRGGPPTKAQAWNTWFWLLINKTYHAVKAVGQYSLVSWYPDHGIIFRGVTISKKGC